MLNNFVFQASRACTAVADVEREWSARIAGVGIPAHVAHAAYPRDFPHLLVPNIDDFRAREDGRDALVAVRCNSLSQSLLMLLFKFPHGFGEVIMAMVLMAHLKISQCLLEVILLLLVQSMK